ncbi:MAG: YncE family protein, partial [Proteobacteria bacterium]|nr:YncE family protein [Pseudomonadota bacterium]
MTDQTADTLSFVDLDTMKETARLTVTGKPAGIAMSPDKATAYITAPDSKELVEIDAVARKIKRRLFLDGG